MDLIKSSDLSNVFNNLGDKLKSISSTKTIFGDPIKEKDITIIPVGKVQISGGGGFGGGETEEQESKPEKKETENEKSRGVGGGFGGNIHVKPIGYIKIKDGNAEFVEIVDKADLALKGLALASILFLVKILFWKKHHK